MAAKRKRMYNSSLSQPNGSAAPVFPPISSTVANAFTALGKANAHLDLSGPRQVLAPITPSSQISSRPDSQESIWAHPPPGFAAESSFSQSQSQLNLLRLNLRLRLKLAVRLKLGL